MNTEHNNQAGQAATTQPAELPALSDERAAFEAARNREDQFPRMDFDLERDGIEGLSRIIDEIAWRSWQARAALAAAGAQAQVDQAPADAHGLTADDLDRCRQWFNSVQDTNGGYLDRADYVLAERIYRALGQRVPSSVTDPLGLLASDVQPKHTPLAAQAAPAVPEGFVLVPVEPTPQMLERGCDAAVRGWPTYGDAAHLWSSMLAAAPTPAAQAPAWTFTGRPQDVPHYAFPLETICATCGESWGSHLGAMCPAGDGRTFQPAAPQPTKERP